MTSGKLTGDHIAGLISGKKPRVRVDEYRIRYNPMSAEIVIVTGNTGEVELVESFTVDEYYEDRKVNLTEFADDVNEFVSGESTEDDDD